MANGRLAENGGVPCRTQNTGFRVDMSSRTANVRVLQDGRINGISSSRAHSPDLLLKRFAEDQDVISAIAPPI
jgi:hypothetical protein